MQFYQFFKRYKIHLHFRVSDMPENKKALPNG